MRRAIGVMIGMAAGIALAGVAAAVLIPVLPSAWRSEGLVWVMAAVVVATSVGIAVLFTAPRRE